MEGTKIKNIVILILLLLNGFLLVLMGGRYFQDSSSNERALDSAIQIIQAGGIKLDETVIPKQTTFRELQAVRDPAHESQLAEKMLGGAVTVEARGGDVYRCYNQKGWIQFHGTGEFLAEFEQELFALGEQTAAQHGAAVLERLGFHSQVLEDTVTRGNGSVVFRQMLGQTPLLDCRVTLNYRNGALVSITNGRRLPGEPYETERFVTAPTATALMRLYNGLKDLGDVYNQIESITPAHTLSVNLTGTAQLTPVWYVETDIGAYKMNLRTGQLVREDSLGAVQSVADASVRMEEPSAEQTETPSDAD